MDGVLNIYKPAGMTSFDVVRKIKKLAGTKKVGHTGTLDPDAYGVLPICVGIGTKIVDFIMEDVKVYSTTLKLGVITDTYDSSGKVIKTNDVNNTEDEVRSAILSFQGDIIQVPPMYSALKINGKRLYELARQGIEVERKGRRIRIYSIEIHGIELPYVNFTVTCSKGTYIRSLCYDIGEKLNCGGAMWKLERTKTGIFSKEDSVPLENINSDNIKDYLISVDSALHNFNPLTVDIKYKKFLLNGVPLRYKGIISSISDDKVYRVYLSDGEFVGLGRKEEETLKIIKLLNQVN